METRLSSIAAPVAQTPVSTQYQAQSDAQAQTQSQSPTPTPTPTPNTVTTSPRRSQMWWEGLNEARPAELRAAFLERYQVGSYASHLCGGHTKKFDVPADPLTIVLYGPSSSGKSSFVNTLVRVVNDEQDFNPVAPLQASITSTNHMTRSKFVKSYPLGQKGQVEIWDVRGTWFTGQPNKDFAIISDLKLGYKGVGDTWETAESDLETKMVPVGGYQRRFTQLTAFVIDFVDLRPSVEAHLAEILQLMHHADFPYVVIFAKAEKILSVRSNLVPQNRTKVSGVPGEVTFYMANYHSHTFERTMEQDRNAIWVLLKMLIIAERGLLQRPLSPSIFTRVAHIAWDSLPRRPLFGGETPKSEEVSPPAATTPAENSSLNSSSSSSSTTSFPSPTPLLHIILLNRPVLICVVLVLLVGLNSLMTAVLLNNLL